MSKVYTYMILSIGLTFLLQFAGIPTVSEGVINWLALDLLFNIENISNIGTSTFFLAIATLFTIGTGSGIAISVLTKSPAETFLVAPIALGIFTVVTSVFLSILSYTADLGYIHYIIYLLFVPWLCGYGVAIIQFWRGAD